MTTTTIDVERVGTCVHEAGHAVAAVLLGGHIVRAVVGSGASFGARGFVTHDNVADHHDRAVAYAGPYAEARWKFGPGVQLHQVQQVLTASGRRDNQVLWDQAGGLPRDQVEPLLNRCWSALLSVAKQLYNEGELRDVDVRAALGLSTDRQLAASQLSLIASGGMTPEQATRPRYVPLHLRHLVPA